MSENYVAVDSRGLFKGLISMTFDLQTARGASFAVFGLAGAVFIQSWIVEPSIWWFRIQAWLVLLATGAVWWFVRSGQKKLSVAIDNARLDLGELEKEAEQTMEAPQEAEGVP